MHFLVLQCPQAACHAARSASPAEPPTACDSTTSKAQACQPAQHAGSPDACASLPAARRPLRRRRLLRLRIGNFGLGVNWRPGLVEMNIGRVL